MGHQNDKTATKNVWQKILALKKERNGLILKVARAENIKRERVCVLNLMNKTEIQKGKEKF